MADTVHRESPRLGPLPVVMLFLVAAVVGGGSLLLSAESGRHMEGAIPWHEQSLLRAVVQLLSLNYRFPTLSPGEVKNYLLGIGAGLGIIIFAVGVAARDPARQALEHGATSEPPRQHNESGRSSKSHVAPLVAAQVLVVLFLIWAMVSSAWSTAPDLAARGSILVTIYFLWALTLGNALDRRAVAIAAYVLIAVTAATAAIAVWYHYGRNPLLRAMFPYGNPTFLSASLIPGILLSAAAVIGIVGERAGYGAVRTALLAVGFLATIGLALWAFYLADSRGPAAGLAFGLVAMWFFAARRHWRLPPAAIALLMVIGGAIYLSRTAEAASPTGRDATLRFRTYAWSYAWQMFSEKPFTGHGQGAFVLHGDSYAVQDVLSDPLVFTARIAHAHNEWLEVLADLGSVGLVLCGGALLLTIRAGMATVDASSPRDRWFTIALLSGLVALFAEESFGPGLRVSGVPTWFYTILGLAWASSAPDTAGLADRLAAARATRLATGVLGAVLGLTVLAISHADWKGARRAYRADLAYQEGDNDQAIRLAEASTGRLNTQRALLNLFRLSEAYLVKAQSLQHRAYDRERRGLAVQPHDQRVVQLAYEDYRLSDALAQAAAERLEGLLSRAPGFMNAGRLAYAINLTRARNAEAFGRVQPVLSKTSPDPGSEPDYAARAVGFIRRAAESVKQELLRRPFDPAIALEYVSAAGPSLQPGEIIELMARPLRYNRMPPDYLSLLSALTARSDFAAALSASTAQAFREISERPPAGEPAQSARTWAPERLRLAAAVRFTRGEYAAARDALEAAVNGYEALASPFLLGTASAYAELADIRFFSRPLEPDEALLAAEKALTHAPRSRIGRELSQSVRQRMVNYFLAAGDEDRASRTVREITPVTVSDDAVRAELAARYAYLCQSILTRVGVTADPTGARVRAMREWIQRSIELDPRNIDVHRAGAMLALETAQETTFTAHFLRAVELGLSAEAAEQLLATAERKWPGSEAVKEIRRRFRDLASQTGRPWNEMNGPSP